MLEIDGEFFDDPCDVRKKERAAKIAGIITGAAVQALINSSKGIPSELSCISITTSRVHVANIMHSPLFPNSGKFKEGGIVLETNV